MRKQSTTEDVDFFDKSSSSKRSVGLLVEGYPVEGLSIGGQETCVIFPSLRMAFDIGRCPQRAISQHYLFISHGHLDHIVTHTMTSPEIAFTGDTTSDFVVDPDNTDVLKARILVMESTFVDNAMSIEHAREYGHTHLSEISSHADKFQNKALILIHFSARYTSKEVEAAIANMPATLADRTYALLEGL